MGRFTNTVRRLLGVPPLLLARLSFRSVCGVLFLGGALLTTLPLPVPAAHAVEPGSTLFVQVKSSRLRSEPKHWASGLAEVVFGGEVKILSAEGDWYRVSTGDGLEGFLHSSAVTARSIVFKGRATELAASAEPNDVVLAGKGFANQLETVFRSGEPGLDYAAVDRLEQRVVDEAALEKFLKAGKLRVGIVERGPRG